MSNLPTPPFHFLKSSMCYSAIQKMTICFEGKVRMKMASALEGKHKAAKFRQDYSAPLAPNITNEDALPLITIRNPYDWMISMCEHSYTAKWSRYKKWKHQICPHLVYTNSTAETKWPVEVTVTLANQELRFGSLAHL